jgi:hypothetical protein
MAASLACSPYVRHLRCLVVRDGFLFRKIKRRLNVWELKPNYWLRHQKNEWAVPNDGHWGRCDILEAKRSPACYYVVKAVHI